MTAIMKKNIILLLLIALPSVAAADVVNGIAAIVNDDPITTYEVRQEASLIAREVARKQAPAMEKTQLDALALDQLIDKKLGAQKIKELDIHVSDDEVRQAIDEVRKQNNLTPEALVSALQGQGLTFEQYKMQMKEQIERLRLMGQDGQSKDPGGRK